MIHRIIYAVVVITTAFLVFMPIDTEFEHGILKPNINSKNEKYINENIDNIIVSYKNINARINDNKQVINILEIKNYNNIYNVVPVLSHDSIYGFETTTSMAKRKKADAAVNGGFFYPYGQPAGIIIIDGDLCSTPADNYNRKVFIQDDKGNFFIKSLDFEYFIQIGKRKLKIDGVNREPIGNEIILFTRLYGKTNRLNGVHSYSLMTENKYLNEEMLSTTERNILSNEFVLSSTGSKINVLKEFYHNNKDNYNKLELVYIARNFTDQIKYAFEGGFWVIKDEEIVINKNEPWVGLTTNREPRTAIGIKKDGMLVLVTVDGRQPGYSVGLSGTELGAYLLKYGITQAIMLDGGASTTMVVNGKIVNKPSYRNEERMVGGSICIIK